MTATFERSPIRWYRLAEDGKTPIPLQSQGEVLPYLLYEAPAENRHVAVDQVGDAHICTVFAAQDRSLNDDDKPLLWETVISDETGEDVYCERYSSYEAALEGHKHAVTMVEQGGGA